MNSINSGGREFVKEEPLQFSDDEPLSDSSCSTDSLHAKLENIRIKTVPERLAVAASVSVPEFSVLVGIKASSLLEDARLSSHRAPVDLVLVLDDSGSMQGVKMELVKHAVRFVIDNLGPSDRLSIVSFATKAERVLRLARMTDLGQEEAKRAVNSLQANGNSTNIVEGLKKGVRVLEERRQRNPVSAIFFLSDGQDNCHNGRCLQFLPASIRTVPQQEQPKFPVHAFGFGQDHDPVTMNTIAEVSDGTFSSIESYDIVHEAFASCIGGLLTVVAQDLRLMLTSASLGVQIKSIPSARYAVESSQVTVRIGDLYADEEKEFLVILSVPILPKSECHGPETRMPLLNTSCSYAVASSSVVLLEGDTVEIRRPKDTSASDMELNTELDRQMNRLRAADAIAKAQEMAESGNLVGARELLSKCKSELLVSVSVKAEDLVSRGLVDEMDELMKRMVNRSIYEQSGRAFILSWRTSLSRQRASTRGNNVPGASSSLGLVAYATPNMETMVAKSLKIKKEIKKEQ